jgi:hypothetical protein
MDVTGRLFNSMGYQPNMTIRRYRQALAAAIVFFAAPCVAEPTHGNRLLQQVQDKQVADDPRPEEPDTNIFALMSGRCPTLRIAGRNFACRAVAFFQSEHGRANFTIALDDPADDSHIITFSGDNGRRSEDNRYQLPIDRMLLNSKHRPRVDGLPVPFTETSAGTCTQLGNFAARQVSSISCSAMDRNGRKYELRFESDGEPITIRKVRRTAPSIRLDPSN